MKLIEKQVKRYPIQVLSRTLGIARSRIYRHLEGKVSSRRKASERLDQAIRQVYLESNKIYGAPKVYAALIRQGIKTSLKRVQRHMKAMGIRSIIRKRYRPCCSKQAKPVCHHPNILKQDFNTPTVNQVWCTDITYIYTLQEGWTYLASVLELHSRKVIGWSYSRVMNTALVLKAIKNACNVVRNTLGIVLHTDQGSQYMSTEFERYLQTRGLVHSASRKGCPYDNACMESFHASLKKEEVYMKQYRNYEEAQVHLFKYIEGWYNTRRLHSSLGYQTPDDVYQNG